jgi:hypothetical protein
MIPAAVEPAAPPAPASQGLPQERLARIAARRAFVQMKQAYMNAASDITDATGDMLQHRIRKASEPWELWSVRAVLLASLKSDHQRTPEHLTKLGRGFDSIFSGNSL